MSALKFRKKPVEIEALQWDGTNEAAVCRWILNGGGRAHYEIDLVKDGHVVIGTLEGNMRASVGDWIIRGVQGEFYPCKPDIFEATYDPVS